MVEKYQNEISPIIYYGISTKINEKDLKIPILQPPDWKSPYWMSLSTGDLIKTTFSRDIVCETYALDNFMVFIIFLVSGVLPVLLVKKFTS